MNSTNLISMNTTTRHNFFGTASPCALEPLSLSLLLSVAHILVLNLHRDGPAKVWQLCSVSEDGLFGMKEFRTTLIICMCMCIYI